MQTDKAVGNQDVTSIRGKMLCSGERLADFFLVPARISDESVRDHKTYVVILLLLLLTPFFLQSDHQPRGKLSVLGHELPAMCLIHHIFAAECPGCGLTRSFAALTRGEVRMALSSHRIGILLYLFFLFQLCFRAYCLRKRGRSISLTVQYIHHHFALLMLFLLLGNWVVGMFLGSNGL